MIWIVGAVVLIVLSPPAYLVAWRTRSKPVDTLVREHLLERYIVTVTSGETFSGLLSGVDDRSIVLQDVTVLSANNSSVDGELVLRRSAVAYMQRP